jgi:hypothetical protein
MFNIAQEYRRLSLLPTLTDEDADRLQEILELSCKDEGLSEELNKIDRETLTPQDEDEEELENFLYRCRIFIFIARLMIESELK